MPGTLWDFCGGGAPAALSRIKERPHVTPPAVTNLLRVLENKRLVYRRADAGNRRKTLVFLSGEGKRVFREARALVDGFSARIRRRPIRKIKKGKFSLRKTFPFSGNVIFFVLEAEARRGGRFAGRKGRHSSICLPKKEAAAEISLFSASVARQSPSPQR